MLISNFGSVSRDIGAIIADITWCLWLFSHRCNTTSTGGWTRTRIQFRSASLNLCSSPRSL